MELSRMDATFQFIERLLSLVDRYGIGLTVVGIIIFFAVKYGPSLIKAHTSFLSSSEETNRRLAEGLESHAETYAAAQLTSTAFYKASKESHEMACRCGHHFCDVIETVGKKLDIEDKIVDSIESIRRELERTKAQ
jgi:hypothetical protein